MALTLDQIRKENPAFANTTDEGLIKYLHKTSYSDMPFEELAKKVGYESPKDEAGNIRSYATIPFQKGVGNVGRAVGYGLEASGAAPATGRLLQESADELDTTLTGRQSKQAQLDAQHKIFNDKDEWQGLNAGAISQQVFQSLPDMAVMGVVGQGLAKAIEAGLMASGAGEAISAAKKAKDLKKAGTISDIVEWAGTSIGFGAAEGVDAGASNAAQTQQEIRKTPIDVLSKTQAFQETLANETDPKLDMEKRQELARDLVARKAGDFVFQDTAIKTGGISAAMGGGGLGLLSRGTEGGILKGATKGIATGAAEEAYQSAFEQRTQNQARKDFIKPGQELNQGVLNSAVEGAITGGVMGIGEGAGAGAKNKPDSVPVPTPLIDYNSLDNSILNPHASSPLSNGVVNVGQSKTVDQAIAAAGAAVNAPATNNKPAAKPSQYDEALNAAAQKYGVPIDLLKAVGMQESGLRQFDKDGNTIRSSEDALGMYQIIHNWHPEYDKEKLAKDPVYNINAGAEFLGELLKKHNGDQAAALKGYYGSKDPAANDKYASEVLSRMTGAKSPVQAETASPYSSIDGEVLKPQAQAQSPLSMTTNLDEIQRGLSNEQTEPFDNRQLQSSTNAGGIGIPIDNGVVGNVEPILPNQDGESLADNRESGDTLTQQAQRFSPTHETSDGTLVQQVVDNVFKDVAGNEIVDDYAEPIKANVPEQARAAIATEEQQAPTNQRTVIQNETQPISSNVTADTTVNSAAVRTDQEQPTIPAAQEEISAATLRTQPEAQGVNKNPTVPTPSPIPAPIEGKRYGEVGGKLATGETVLTASGRETTPFPKFQNKNGITTAVHTKLVDSWLMTNAFEEAKARGDKFNAQQFEENKNKPTPADKDSAEQYLFEKQPDVPAPLLKDLNPTNKESLTVQNEISKQPTGGTIAPDAGAQMMATVNNPNAAKQPKPKAVRVVQIKPERDTLIQAIAKLGGINTAHAVSQGLDVSNGKLNRKFGSGIKRTFTTTSKETFDSMAEALRQYGYTGKDGKPLDAESLLQAVSDSVNSGVNHYTPAGHAAIAQEAQEEKYTTEEAEFSLRIQNLLDKAKQVSEQYQRQIEQSIAKGYIDHESINEYEEETDGLIEAKTKANSQESTDEVAQEEPIATSYTEPELKQREQEQKQRDLTEKKADQVEKGNTGQDDLVDEFLGKGQTNDVFGMTNPLEKPQEPSKKQATLESIPESKVKDTKVEVEGVGEVSADKVLAHIREKINDIESFIKCVRG